ncbi:hypothetical protein M0R45_009687 [Rubus argutus]|uniref:Uncharacterized protein n=1 Tax=Rubus argutus TaxID=59490 RepID=A0AAW1Y5L5_RUBAR
MPCRTSNAPCRHQLAEMKARPCCTLAQNPADQSSLYTHGSGATSIVSLFHRAQSLSQACADADADDPAPAALNLRATEPNPRHRSPALISF